MQRGLDLANWDGENVSDFVRLEERLLVGGDLDAGASILAPIPAAEDQAERGLFYRDRIIRELVPLVRDTVRTRPRPVESPARHPLDVRALITRGTPADSGARALMLSRLAKRLHGRVASIVVAHVDSGGTLSLGSVHRPATLHDAIELVLAMLLATDEPLAMNLRQCSRSTCFNIHLNSRRKYCGDACMEAVHEAGHAERQAAYNAGMSLKQYKANKSAAEKRRARRTK